MKNGPAYRKAGFTLVELLVSIALVTILVGSGTSVALKASQRKQVEQAGLDFQGALEQARANALAGKKINCAEANDTLAGWGVAIESINSFSLNEYCGQVYGNNPKRIVFSKTYPAAISISASGGFPIIFKPLGQGIRSALNPFPNKVTVTVSGFGYSKAIDLYRSGQISAP